jgi:hypothetical protein
LLAIKPGVNTTARFSAVMRVTAEFSALQRSARKSNLNETRKIQTYSQDGWFKGCVLHVKQEHCIQGGQFCHDPLQHLPATKKVTRSSTNAETQCKLKAIPQKALFLHDLCIVHAI